MRWSKSSEGRSGGGGRRLSPLPRRAQTRTVCARLTPLRVAARETPLLRGPKPHAPLLLLPLLLQGAEARCSARPPANAMADSLAMRWPDRLGR